MLDMSLKRMIAGKRAKKHGDEFENILKSAAARDGFDVTRMENGCVTRGPNRIQRIRTPYDFVFIRSRIETFFADAKSTDNKTFAHSQIVPHQLEKLLKIEFKGGVAGYLVYFRATSEIIWFTASKLNSLSKRQSLKPSDGLLLGSRFSIRFGGLFI